MLKVRKDSRGDDEMVYEFNKKELAQRTSSERFS